MLGSMVLTVARSSVANDGQCAISSTAAASVDVFLEMAQRRKRVTSAVSSVTATSRLPTVMESMRKAARVGETRACDQLIGRVEIAQYGRARRTIQLLADVSSAIPANARIGP